MFTNPARLKAKEKYMQGMSAVTEQEQSYLKNQLLAQAKQYYYDQVILTRKLALLENTRDLLEYMLKDANIRLTYGKEKLTSIYKAKADLYVLDDTKEQLNNEVQQNTIMLNTLMNQNKQTAFAVDTNVAIKDYEAGLTDTSTLAASRNRSDLSAFADDSRVSHCCGRQARARLRLLRFS